MSSIDPDNLAIHLSAYIDGELTEDESALVEQLLEESAEARELMAELRQTVDLVGALPRHQAPNTILDDVCRHIEREGLLGGVDDSSILSGPRTTRRTWRRPLAAAATIGLVVIGGTWAVMSLSNRGMLGSYGTLLSKTDSASEVVVLPPTVSESMADKGEATDDLTGGDKMAARGAVVEPKTMVKDLADTAAVAKVAPDKFAGVLNLDQKIKAGITGRALLDHSFHNESNHLSIKLADASKRDQLGDVVEAFCAEQGMTDIRGGRVSADQGENSQFFYGGRPGVNFESRSSRQIILRIPGSKLASLMERLDGEAASALDASLELGPVVAQGWQEASVVGRSVSGARSRVELPTAPGRGRAMASNEHVACGGRGGRGGGAKSLARARHADVWRVESEEPAEDEAVASRPTFAKPKKKSQAIAELIRAMGIDDNMQADVAGALRDGAERAEEADPVPAPSGVEEAGDEAIADAIAPEMWLAEGWEIWSGKWLERYAQPSGLALQPLPTEMLLAEADADGMLNIQAATSGTDEVPDHTPLAQRMIKQLDRQPTIAMLGNGVSELPTSPEGKANQGESAGASEAASEKLLTLVIRLSVPTPAESEASVPADTKVSSHPDVGHGAKTDKPTAGRVDQPRIIRDPATRPGNQAPRARETKPSKEQPNTTSMRVS